MTENTGEYVAAGNPTLTADSFRARMDEVTDMLNLCVKKPEVQAIPEVYDVLMVLGEMVLMAAAGAHQALVLGEHSASSVEDQ